MIDGIPDFVLILYGVFALVVLGIKALRESKFLRKRLIERNKSKNEMFEPYYLDPDGKKYLSTSKNSDTSISSSGILGFLVGDGKSGCSSCSGSSCSGSSCSGGSCSGGGCGSGG